MRYIKLDANSAACSLTASSTASVKGIVALMWTLWRDPGGPWMGIFQGTSYHWLRAWVGVETLKQLWVPPPDV